MSKVKLIMVKVDYEKAYDSLKWDYLIYMMDWLRFHNKWR